MELLFGNLATRQAALEDGFSVHAFFPWPQPYQRRRKILPMGVLRILGRSAGMSQQELALILKIHPSSLVAILDELETRGLLERRENAEDRRSHALHLTAKGTETLAEIGKIAREHNDALLAALPPREREHLSRLLQVIADDQGLTPGVRPGYSRFGAGRGPNKGTPPGTTQS
jgi:DNA-binding MarR family transcriptional regulator